MIDLNDPRVQQILPLAFSADEVAWIEENFPCMAADQTDISGPEYGVCAVPASRRCVTAAH